MISPQKSTIGERGVGCKVIFRVGKIEESEAPSVALRAMEGKRML